MARRHRPILRFVLWVVSHPRATLAITLLIAAASVGLAMARLNISTDQNKLFSAKVPFFHDYLKFDELFPENEAVFVVLQAKGDEHAIPVERWTHAADAIARRLAAMPQHVKSVDARVPLDKLGAQGLLFEDPAQVPKIVEDVRTRFIPLIRLFAEPADLTTRLLGATPVDRFLAAFNAKYAFVPPGDPEEARFVTLLAKSWERTLRAPVATQPSAAVSLPDLASLDASDPSRLGYYYVPDERDRSRHLLLVRAYPDVDYSSLTAISEAVEGMRAAVREAVKDFPEFTAGVTGRPALAADEMRTTDEDSNRAEAVALTAVFIGLVVLLRSFWLALAAELALGVGIAWTFGWTTLTLGELNLLSIVFLLALIGIGMDYLVQILSRYRAEAARRRDSRTVWVAVFRQVGPPINTACLGAAGAFLVSMFTDFQGAADLGLIAGGGLVLCLLAGYTFLPALLTIRPVRAPKSGPEAIRVRSDEPDRERRWWVGPVLWLSLLAIGIPFALRPKFNPNLLQLQATKLDSVKLVRHLQTWSAVVLSKDLGALREARAAVLASPRVAKVESILSVYDNHEALTGTIPPLPKIDWAEPAAVSVNAIPGLAAKANSLAEHFEKSGKASEIFREAAKSLRAFAAALGESDAGTAAARLSAWQVGFVGELRQMLAQFTPAPVNLLKVPEELRSHFVADDGTYAMYVLPKEDLWDERTLDPFVADIEPRLAALTPRVVLTGIAHNVHHTTSSIRRSFFKATFYALGLIVVLVLIDLRRVSHTLLAVSVLALGLPMLVALMGLLKVDWNFANFFGLPILIGAGHEYGVFLVHRYREGLRDGRREWGRWDVADGALALCAFVTSSCFGFFFLLAHHRGLRSLGLVMALGTACIYLASVVALRPILKWRLARAGRNSGVKAKEIRTSAVHN
jgi:hopanoid biosynthesis associated RND transporter like protein HpnN